jgi:hypothetical protein
MRLKMFTSSTLEPSSAELFKIPTAVPLASTVKPLT